MQMMILSMQSMSLELIGLRPFQSLKLFAKWVSLVTKIRFAVLDVYKRQPKPSRRPTAIWANAAGKITVAKRVKPRAPSIRPARSVKSGTPAAPCMVLR